jgi:hypothetical protein
MALDQYSLCPCGSGKKIKFCKCHEHWAELEKLDRMIAGEQLAAALDHANYLLKTMPSEPWLLAMKCDILVQLREFELLEEASAKFIRLQPDNPLAKFYRSLVATFRGNDEESSSLLLQGFASSKNGVHPIFFSAMLTNLRCLLNNGKLMTYLMHAELFDNLVSDSESEISSVADRAVRTFKSDPNISVLLREAPPSPPSVDDQPYAERYREALGLFEILHISECRTKVDGIIREFGHEAPLLILKLNTQLYLADSDGATETCLRLVKAKDLPEAQRVYFQALAFVISPTKTGLYLETEIVEYPIDDAAALEEKLVSCPRLTRLGNDEGMNPEFLQRACEEEVPPKLFLAEIQAIEDDRLNGQQASRYLNWLGLWGKQTDKPARLVSLESKSGRAGQARTSLLQELGIDVSTRQVKRSSKGVVFAEFAIDSNLGELEIDSAVRDSIQQRLRDDALNSFLEFPFPFLNGGTPSNSATKPEYRTEILALLLVWIAEGNAIPSDSEVRQLHSRLGLEQPKLDPQADTFDLVGGASYFWIDFEAVDKDTLLIIAQSALSRRIWAIADSVAAEIRKRSWSDEEFPSADFTRLSLSALTCEDMNQAEKIYFELAEKARVLKILTGPFVMQRCRMLVALGRVEEMAEYLLASYQKSPDDPVLMQEIQRMVGMAKQQGSSRSSGQSSVEDALLERSHVGRSKAAAPASSSKLWTPDQPDTANTSSGESSLWIP